MIGAVPNSISRLRGELPAAATSTVAVLATFGSAVGVKHVAGLTDSAIVLAVVLAVTLSRRQPGRSRSARMFALVVLPVVSVGATEIGTQVYQRPDLGDALFVLAVSASVWARRFRGPIARIGSIAGLPLIATLIAPAGSAGSSSGGSLWWTALIATLPLVWVTACFTLAERFGLLPVAPVAEPARRPRSGPAAIDRMALRLLVSLALAFALGRWLFGPHWPWLVITAFVVGNSAPEYADVAWRGLQRVAGAAVGTLAATALTAVSPAASPWSVVLIFAVLALAAWLRPINYAYWAAGITSVLALLYGYFGERGTGLLTERLEEIALGAAVTVAVSWSVTLVPLPDRRSDPLREATVRVLGYVNRQHGLDYRLVRPLGSDSYLVQNAAGAAVLRWSRERGPAAPFDAGDAMASGATPKGHTYALSPRRDPM